MSVRYLNATGTQALIDTIKQRLSAKADQSSIDAILQQVQLLQGQIPTKVSQLANDVPYLSESSASEVYATQEDLDTLTTLVNQNQNAINLLNADHNTQGSVDYKIEQAIEALPPPASISAAEIEALF